MAIIAPKDVEDTGPVTTPLQAAKGSTGPAPQPAPPQKSGKGYTWPTKGRVITSQFGAHHGIDIDGQSGDPIVAPVSGTVVFAGDSSSSGYGGLVIIQDAYGMKHYLSHLRSFGVQEGDVIDLGTFIGEMGGAAGDPMQGNSSGSHLHYEVRIGSGQVNPLDFFGGQPGQYGGIELAPSNQWTPTGPHDTSGSQPAAGGTGPGTGKTTIKAPTIKTPLGEMSLGEDITIDWGRIIVGLLGLALILVGVLSLAGEEAIGAAAGKVAKPIAAALKGEG